MHKWYIGPSTTSNCIKAYDFIQLTTERYPCLHVPVPEQLTGLERLLSSVIRGLSAFAVVYWKHVGRRSCSRRRSEKNVEQTKEKRKIVTVALYTIW